MTNDLCNDSLIDGRLLFTERRIFMQLFGGGTKLLTKNDTLITRNFFTGSHKNWTKLPTTDSNYNVAIFNYEGFFTNTREMSDYVISLLVDNSHGSTYLRLQCWTPKQFYFGNRIESGQCGLLTLTLPADLFSKQENYNNGNIVINTGLQQGDTNALFKHEMLESGSIPSNWLPAPEDWGFAMKSDLDALKAEINQLKQGK